MSEGSDIDWTDLELAWRSYSISRANFMAMRFDQSPIHAWMHSMRPDHMMLIAACVLPHNKLQEAMTTIVRTFARPVMTDTERNILIALPPPHSGAFQAFELDAPETPAKRVLVALVMAYHERTRITPYLASILMVKIIDLYDEMRMGNVREALAAELRVAIDWSIIEEGYRAWNATH